MKKYMFLAAIAATVLAAGCAKEPFAEEAVSGESTTTITASLEPLTKASLDRSKVKVTWNAGDAINVNGSVSNALAEATATALFTFENPVTAPYKAVYPASIYKDDATVTLPGEVSVDGLNLALAGYASRGNNISFSAITAILQVSLTGEATTTLKEIVLKGLAGEQMSGDFAIDHKKKTLTGSSSADADKEVKVTVGKALSAEPLVVYLPIPAANYASGYQVEFIDSNDDVMRMRVSARNVSAGELREMPELAFAPNQGEEIPIGGIPDAAELKAFAAAVNAGDPLTRWMNDAGEIELQADIDLGGEEWIPIGNAAVTSAHAITGNAFTGVFNGGNHTVDNFKVTVPATGGGSVAGLFGAVSNATIKDLNIGDKAVLKTSSTAFVTMGGVVGFASGSTLENLDSHARLVNDGGSDNVRLVIGGTIGTMFSTETNACVATGIKGHASFDVVNTVNTKNGATGFIVGGVIGFTDGAGEGQLTQITDCTNYSSFTAQATRTAGVISTMNRYSKAEGCVNYGNISCTDTKASNSRVAGIVSAMGTGVILLKDCINYGDVVFAVSGDSTHGYAGGVIGQNNADTEIDGCASYGSVLSDRWFATEKYMGIISGNFNTKKVTVKNCILGGKIGPYTPTTEDPVVELNATNFEQYYSLIAEARLVNVTYENNTFGGAPAPVGIASAADLAAFRDAVNAGTSIEQWQDVDGAVKLLADIDLTGVDWTPIGNPTSTNNGNYAGAYTGSAFKGVFDGGGHSITGFTVDKTLAENTTYGLFGVLDGATVKNLKVSGSYKIAAQSVADAGVIAGLMVNSTIENVSFDGTVNIGGCATNNKRFAIGGIAGFVGAGESAGSVIRNCTVTATVTASAGSSTAAGATSVMYGGIVGFITALKEELSFANLVEGCVNNGTLNTNLGRSSGIAATVNSNTILKDCVNNANQVNNFVNGRVGNIASNVYYRCGLVNCVNNGSLTTSDAQTTTGGFSAMLSDATS